ncbi:Pr6Pr family membrane protein [Streptomyces polyrhachis]|uniref:Pr6Pr family membrane protein n=1 Tax=Streptomyces polyrhachis TaxID=1282885 RepID=A0ABW2GJK7_9ACTN
MWKIIVFGWLRLGLGVLAAVALGFQAHRAAGYGALGNYFSYFTILSNAAGSVVLLLGGAAVLRGRPSPVPDAVRGAVTVYLAITGAVYQLLLAHLPGQDVIPWVNTVTHQVMPLAAVAYWLADPPRTRTGLRTAAGWLAFPLAYLGYSLLRGPLVDWYPYPFVDPREPGGYGHVAGQCAGVTAGFLLAVALIAWLGNVRGAQVRRRLTDGQPLSKI